MPAGSRGLLDLFSTLNMRNGTSDPLQEGSANMGISQIRIQIQAPTSDFRFSWPTWRLSCCRGAGGQSGRRGRALSNRERRPCGRGAARYDVELPLLLGCFRLILFYLISLGFFCRDLNQRIAHTHWRLLIASPSLRTCGFCQLKDSFPSELLIASVNFSGKYDSRTFSQLVSFNFVDNENAASKSIFIPIIHLEMIIIFSHERSHKEKLFWQLAQSSFILSPQDPKKMIKIVC